MTNTDVSTEVEYELPTDWRGEVMAKIRKLMKEADPNIIEDVKWKKPSNPAGNLVWYNNGMICTGEIYKKHLRFTFSKGVALKDQDPKCLLNSYRAMLIHEEDKLDETAFKNLIRAAVALNNEGK